MRKLPPRGELPQALRARLKMESDAINVAADPKAEAVRRYDNARQSKWFKPILVNLQEMSGIGQRCMFCSGSESSQIEHFRPKAIFPLESMNWENFLWVCGICNQSKGDRFPPNTEAGVSLINPVDEDIWEFFFIDEFGNLSARWRTDLNDLDPRAVKTVEILALDRDALQESRQHRLDDLKKRICDSLELFRHGHLDQAGLCTRYDEWRKQPFQPDVADYFLGGPGRAEMPFAEFCAQAQC